MSFFSPRRQAALGIATFLVLLFFFYALHEGPEGYPIQRIKETAQSAAENLCSATGNEPVLPKNPPTQYALSHLFDSIKHPISEKTYIDPGGRHFNYGPNPSWRKSLGSNILIVDMDTRVPNGTNQIWNPGTIDWKNLPTKEDGGLTSASFMNHYLYSQIHGYDYRFYNALSMMPDHHDTWIKPHVLFELLHSYRFVVFVDADATFQHLELPIEWLFNKWQITPKTSIAMPIDTKQVLNNDTNTSCDSKGNVTLNTGLVIAQALPYTFEMMKAWKECTDEKRYPGCGTWKGTWSHEQRAFSEYIRYDFNPENNIVSIPCDDAMGYPGLMDNHPHIISNCTGQFVRHHTIDKEWTKISSDNAMLQSLTQIMHKSLLKEQDRFWLREAEMNKSFMDRFEESQ